MTVYTEDWASALDSIKEAGVAVTFTRTTQTEDTTTGLMTTATTTIAGYAIRTKGKPDTYVQLGLIESVAPTLLFAPNTFGGSPKMGDTVVFSGVNYTVKDAAPIAPDGNTLISRIIVAV